MEILIAVLVIGAVLGVVVAFVAPRLRDRGPELEPPEAPRRVGTATSGLSGFSGARPLPTGALT